MLWVWNFKCFIGKLRLRAPKELLDLLHKHYDDYKHELSGKDLPKLDHLGIFATLIPQSPLVFSDASTLWRCASRNFAV